MAPLYSRIARYAWRERIDPNFDKTYTESTFVTHLCQKYGILKRTANSINHDVRGRIQALEELKKTELKQCRTKAESTEKKIESLKKQLDILKPMIEAGGTERQLSQYHRYGQKLYWKKNRLNALRQREKALEYEIEHPRIVGFGGKDLFRKQFRLAENGYITHQKWLNDYRKARDGYIFWLGSGDESYGNQMFQMSYDEVSRLYTARIRKEKQFCSNNGKYLQITGILIPYLNEYLKPMLSDPHSKKPVSYRFTRRSSRWYLQAMITIGYPEYATDHFNGAIGLDYNDGFIEASETDKSGNLVWQYHYDLVLHRTGGAAEAEIEDVIAQIVNHALDTGKDIIAENLDFRKLKAKMDKGGSKKSRGMHHIIHVFDYSRYNTTLENCCHKHRVGLKLVNPANTSKIGRQKYAKQKKLTVHQAASYVIARRGQGFKDKLKSSRRSA